MVDSDRDEEEEEEEVEEEQINTIKSFKTVECVVCLVNSPNILFCNCEHICVCLECQTAMKEEFNACPLCKTSNPIKRMIE